MNTALTFFDVAPEDSESALHLESSFSRVIPVNVGHL